MRCADCELARDLERHAKLVAQGIEEAVWAERFDLTPEEREALRREEAFLERLLDVIRERRYSTVA